MGMPSIKGLGRQQSKRKRGIARLSILSETGWGGGSGGQLNHASKICAMTSGEGEHPIGIGGKRGEAASARHALMQSKKGHKREGSRKTLLAHWRRGGTLQFNNAVAKEKAGAPRLNTTGLYP